MITILPQKNPKFICDCCDFKTSNKKDYSRHMLTSKHLEIIKMVTKDTENHKVTQILPQKNKYVCFCCNEYTYNSGLSRHKQKCKMNNTNDIVNNHDLADTESEASSETDSELEPSSKDIIKMMKMQMIENQEIRNLIIELLKKETINTINNNINTNTNCNNNNNNTFNLQVFLNEKCKDALNINEFVDSIKIQMSDLENFAHVDYPDGVSKIFVKNLNNVDTYLRPIHCSDLKREVLYIKNNDEWIKETDEKTLLKNAIKQIAFKNIKQINEWVKENPGCQDPRTKQNVKYNKIVMNSMSGGTIEEQKENMEQIVKNVTKAVVIDKYAVK